MEQKPDKESIPIKVKLDEPKLKTFIPWIIAILSLGTTIYFAFRYFYQSNEMISQTYDELKRMDASQRPIFDIELNANYDPDTTYMTISVLLRNEGVRPTTELSGVALAVSAIPMKTKNDSGEDSIYYEFLPKSLKKEFFSYTETFGQLPYYIWFFTVGPEDKPIFIIVHIEYSDPITGLDYHQPFYVRYSRYPDNPNIPSFIMVKSPRICELDSLPGIENVIAQFLNTQNQQ